MKTITIILLCAAFAAFAQTGYPADGAPPDSVSRPETLANATSAVRSVNSSESLVASAATAWGQPVEGVSLRLQAARAQWSAGETPAFTLELQNQGQRDLVFYQLQELGKLEVDGAWCDWCRGGFMSFHESPFPPGRRYEGFPVTLSPDWWAKQDTSKNPRLPARLPLRLLPGPHTIRFSVTCRDADAPTAKAVRKKGDPIPEVVVTSNPVRIEITTSNEAPSVTANPWGSPVDGVSVQLRAEHFAWTVEDAVALAATMRNQGQRSLRVAQAQQLGELEVDGVSYHWAGHTEVKSSTFPPGRQYNDIPVNLTTNWQTKEGKPLQLGPSRHTVRFIVVAPTLNDTGGTPPIRAVSNPIQLNLVPDVSQRAILVSKYLPGYALRAVRRGSGDQEFIGEVLVTPAGKEIDLETARTQWTGTTGVLAPVGANHSSFIGGGQIWWRNPALTRLAPSLKLKIATPQEAEDITRMIFGLFKGATSLGGRAIKAEPWENGWVVTLTYVGPPAQVQYQGPVELILEEGTLKDVRERGWYGGKPITATSAANAAESGWGEPVKGLSVRLQADKAVLYFAEGVALRLSMRNLGSETWFVPESQEPGELEIDGVWHSFWCSWSDPYYVGRKPLPPGQQLDNIAVHPAGGDWRKDSAPLHA